MVKKLIFLLILLPSICFAGVNLPWSCTYDCDDWTSFSQTLNCCGLVAGLNNQTPKCGKYEEIIAAANRTAGAGGKGQRHYVENGYGVTSGGTMVYFNTLQSEFWIRWYMRFQTGWSWYEPPAGIEHGFKIIYVDDSLDGASHYIIVGIPSARMNDGGCSDIGTGRTRTWAASDPWEACWDHLQSAGETVNAPGTYMHGHKLGDGAWHCWELHAKAEGPTTSSNNGEIHLWLDGTLVASNTSVDTHTSATTQGLTWRRIKIGSNIKYPETSEIGDCMWLDYDDIYISNTGRIGCGTEDPPADETPPVPSNGQPNGNVNCIADPYPDMQLTWNVTDNASAVKDCRISTQDQSYTNMGEGAVTDSTTSHVVGNLACGQEYNYYIACSDMADNSNDADDNLNINFTIGSEVVQEKVWERITSAYAQDTDGGATVTLSFPLATAQNNNRLVVCGCGWEHSSTGIDVTGITFDGTNMTEVHQIKTTNEGYNVTGGLYYILDTDLPAAAGSFNVVATAASEPARDPWVGCVEYTNIKQAVYDDRDEDYSNSKVDMISDLTAVAGDGTSLGVQFAIDGLMLSNSFTPAAGTAKVIEDLDINGAIVCVSEKELESGAQTMGVSAPLTNRCAYVAGTWQGDEATDGDPPANDSSGTFAGCGVAGGG